MYRFDPRRAAIGGVLAVGTGYAALTARENLLPTLAVALLLTVVYWPPLVQRPAVRHDTTPTGRPSGLHARPADAAIIGFTGFFGVLSLLISSFLPTVAARLDMTGMYDGDFVRVTINDSHEFAYAACLLLALRAGFGLWHRFRPHSRALREVVDTRHSAPERVA